MSNISPTASPLDNALPASNPVVGKWNIVAARLLIGFIVTLCAEVFSGASLSPGPGHIPGLISPWFLLLTYWLYFAHFYFFTSMAVDTGRTSFWSLYLWGVLYGLYESWITKVIWSGYGHDGHFALGSIGPYGISELTMVFVFHPIMSFILPLAIACVLCPPLRQLFPDIAWLTGSSRRARIVQGYLVFSFAPVMAMNSFGVLNLAINLLVAGLAMMLLGRGARPAMQHTDGRAIVVFGRRGFVFLCLYLAFLYLLTYSFLLPQCLPSPLVQLSTLAIYGVVIAGLALQPRDRPTSGIARVEGHDLRRAVTVLAIISIAALVLAPLRGTPFLLILVSINFLIWVVISAVLPVATLVETFYPRKLRAARPA